MFFKQLIFTWIFLISLIFLSIGCSSHTLIQTDPLGAKVYIDGLYRGDTPLDYSDRDLAGEQKVVMLKKEGYETAYLTISKEKFQWSPFFGGVFCCFPFVWVLGYPPGYIVDLKKLPDMKNEELQNNNQ